MKYATTSITVSQSRIHKHQKMTHSLRSPIQLATRSDDKYGRSSESYHNKSEKENEVEKSSPQVTEQPHEPTNAKVQMSGPSQQAIRRSRDQLGVDTEVGESSKRPRLDEGRLLNPRVFNHMHCKFSPCTDTHSFAARESRFSDYNGSLSTFKPARFSTFNSDRPCQLDPQTFLARPQAYSQPKAFPTTLISSAPPRTPNAAAPARPTFDQLTTFPTPHPRRSS